MKSYALRGMILGALVGLLFGFAFGASTCKAAPVAVIQDAVLTDERGQCPRLHRVAKREDYARGCWTIDEHTRAITIKWDDGRIDRYSEMQFEIYGKIVQ